MNAVETVPSLSPDPPAAQSPSSVRVQATERPATTAPTRAPAETDQGAAGAWRPSPEADPGTTAASRCSVRPAPEREPSFDDEPRARHLHLIHAGAMPQLPFPALAPGYAPNASPSPAVRRKPEPIRRLSVVPDLPETLVATAAAPSPARFGAQPPAPESATRHRPDPSRFGRQFAQGVVEVLSGRRPMVQLSRHVSPAVQRGLTRAGGSQPLKSPTAPTLHSLHLSEPAAGVCEMSAIVVVGVRYRALAARLEWQIDHWRCTALQIG